MVPPLPETKLDEKAVADATSEAMTGNTTETVGQAQMETAKEAAPEQPKPSLRRRPTVNDITDDGRSTPAPEPISEVVQKAITPLSIQIRKEMEDRFAVMMSEIKQAASAQSNGVTAQLIGGTFNCPECGLRIAGPSMTGQQNALYEHPFGESAKLSGQQCRLKGQKFKAPVIYLEAVKPLPPLTPSGQ
jgi:predicted RNA-binding Zn-ribbon protein involved in translation (DUF1610 family)